jgi:hypothetical protein
MTSIEDEIRNGLRRSIRILSFDKRYRNRKEALHVTQSSNIELALDMIQAENHAYLKGIHSSVKEQNLRVAGSLLRSLLESTANAHWLTQDKTGKRAKRYVQSTRAFTDYVNKTGNKATLTIDKLPREATSWTTSSAEDRINFFSPQAGIVWDYCSIFTHASPSYLALHEGLNKVLSYVISQANTYALTARLTIDDSSNVYDDREKKFLYEMSHEVLLELEII